MAATVTTSTEREVLVARAREAIAQWETDIADIRRSIACGQAPKTEIYTLECIISDRQKRIAQLRQLI